jgi:ferredoxin
MSYKKLSAEQLSNWLDQLARDCRLVAPSRDEEGVVLFKPVTGAARVAASYTRSVVSPKGEFIPQTEKVFEFDTAGGEVAITPSDGPALTSVLFGVRPCDLRSIALLDPVFSGRFQDNQYARRRQSNLVIGLACQEAQSTCFCSSFGISPVDGSGADIMLTREGDSYHAELLTPRGEELAAKYQDLFTPGDAGALENHKQELLARLERSFVRRPEPGAIKQLLDDNFELPYWETLASRCLGCGICTYVCPTCHCFDIFDHTAGGSKGRRFRCWDSCMYADFTLMAGGHNPRPGKKERVRNRFMHKLKYHLDRYGVEGCVGCGRCIEKCPVNIDMARIIDDLKEMV